MKLNRPRVPIGMPIAALVFLGLGLAAGPLIRATASEEQLATNVLLSALPFILIFVGIILGFMTLVWMAHSALSGVIPAESFRRVELVAIGGIILGIFGMFQPWFFPLYKYGFLILLVSTLFYILWSHIRPRGVYDTDLGTVSISNIEHKEIEG
jgi:hypothetical protein